VTIPNVAMKVNDIITATTTVGDDNGDTYGLVFGTIGGFTLSSFNRIDATTYTVQFTITEGGADVAAGSNIPVSLIIDDTAGNQSSEYNTAITQANDPIDANTPAIATVSFNPSFGTLKVGDTATATIHAVDDETGLNASSTMTINNVEVSSTFSELSSGDYIVTYTVSEYDTDIDDDTEDLPINLSLVDDAGNRSAASTTPDITGRPGVDARTPTAPGPLTLNSKTSSSITLNLGATTTEANFSEYKIFYKIGSSGVTEANNLHSSSTDMNLGNIFFYGASTTTIFGLATGTTYVFNIWAYDTAGNKASSTFEYSTATNYAPGSPSSLGQFKSGGAIIANNSWTNESTINLRASAIDADTSEILTFYFEIATSTDSFIGNIVLPCSFDENWNDCGTKVWAITSSLGDYSSAPFIATVTPQLIHNSNIGYKWRVKACDDNETCSVWVDAGTDPNFKIDYTPPSDPGDLREYAKTAVSATLKLGATTTEANFSEYKIFYKAGSSGVTEANEPHSSSTDMNLGNIFFYGATTTIIEDLAASTQYVFNIWAYDAAGNKASATEMTLTTASASNPPTGSFSGADQKRDGTGAVDISITLDDPDNDDTLRARIDYATGTDCIFSPPLDPTIDTGNVSDSHGSPPDIDNNYVYQVGTTSGWIVTSPGANTVSFDWTSKTDEPLASGYYCLQLTANDGLFSQSPLATTSVYIDNTAPSPPGALSLDNKSTYSVDLKFGATSTELNFSEYKIFYKEYDGLAPTESDYVLASSTDNNLENILFYGATTTIISGLDAGTAYSFAVWAYDSYGNKASSSAVDFTTNYLPANPASLGQFKNDGVTVVPNGYWATEDNVKLKASAFDSDTSEVIRLYFELHTYNDDFTTATSVPFGACASTTAWGACNSKIWLETSLAGDYSIMPYTATVNPANMASSSGGYKWQVLSCDDNNVCSDNWTEFNAVTPNFKVDFTAPTAPGQLSIASYMSTSVILAFGNVTVEDNFGEYKIFYSTSTPVTEADFEHSSSSDENLGIKNYGTAATTTISGLLSGELYYFNIFAYDQAGNKASSTETSTTTNTLPTGNFISAVTRRDGTGIVDISIQAADIDGNNAQAKIEYEAGTSCDFISETKATLDEADASATSTYGDAKVENENDYQVGNSSGWIVTASGANTVSFDWLSDT
ncbi:hypothetical protein DRH27_05015, partial [Candidatus Falkowbacteria bacterium]